MISTDQCRHVVAYCASNMVSAKYTTTPTIQRDCILFNKVRGELCADISKDERFKYILRHVHDSCRVHQINSVPAGSVCCIDHKPIQNSTIGVQFIFYTNDDIQHVCVHKKYQELCYAYFKLRNFFTYIESYIKTWLLEQEWYVTRYYTCDAIVERIMKSRLPDIIHIQWVDLVRILQRRAK